MLALDVVIANRNNARFIPQCLDSVFAQSLQPKEVVVVDDASTDASREILETYSRRGKIRLLVNDAQMGVAASRVRAIEESTSPYLTTLDSDDYYYSREKLSSEAAIVTANGSAGVIGFSDVLLVGETGESIGLVSNRRRVREGDLSFRVSHLSGFIPRDYLVSRTDYLAAGGFNSSLHLYEDWELKIRLSKICTWAYSGIVGTAYRANPLGLSKAPRKIHIQKMRHIFAMHCPAGSAASRAFAKARFFLYQSVYLRRPAL